MLKYPLYRPSLAGNEKKYVDECLDSTWVSSKGRFIAEFERAFGDFVGSTHAASVCNGTAAIHLALEALGIGPGDEVVVPTFSYIASVNPNVYCGAMPVFCDSLHETWQMDPDDLRRRITPRTKAMIVPHLYGQACALNELMAVARAHGLKVIEDCAEAFGTTYANRHVGTFGDIAAFSFYGNKTITTGEGGMVVTNDAALHARVSHRKGQGLSPGREYWHDVIGHNYRMTNICAALGLAQLERAPALIADKAQIASWYRECLRGLPLGWPREAAEVGSSHWMVCILTPDAKDRDPLRALLRRRGIETRPFFSPVHRMPMYAAGQPDFPVADDLAARGVCLPSYPGLEAQDVAEIAGAVVAYFG